MASHLYSFFESKTETDTFHIQCEWFNKGKLDLNKESLDQENSAYCLVTVTDLQDYYTCTITHKLLQTNFKESNALLKEQRNNVLEAAFLGEQSFYGHQLQWRIKRDEETNQLNMRLRTFNQDIPMLAGSFSLDKAPSDQLKQLERLWFKNGSIASRTNIGITRALNQRYKDIQKTNSESRDLIETMERKQVETFIVLMDKCVHLLNAKKLKIYHLQNSLKRKRYREIVNKQEQEQVKKEEELSIQAEKKVKIEQPSVKKEDESDWELSDSDICPPQTAR